MTTTDLKQIADLLDQKLEEKLEAKLEEKLETKLEAKLETKFNQKFDQLFNERLEPFARGIQEQFVLIEGRFQGIETRLDGIEKDLRSKPSREEFPALIFNPALKKISIIS